LREARVDLVYLWHAASQMIERSISDDEVRAILADPVSVAPGYVRGRLTYDGTVRGRGLRVVVEGGTDPIVVVTVMLRRSVT